MKQQLNLNMTLDNNPTNTANKMRLKKGTNQEGTGGRTQTIIR